MNRSVQGFATLALLALFGVSVPAVAQFNASVQGTVTDTSGAIIPGATVTVTNQDTGIAKNAKTTNSGFYRVGELPPGTYTVQVEASGFQTNTTGAVQVAAEQPRGVNVQLKPGGGTQTVTVTETTPSLQTENGSVEGQITTRQLTQLPSYGGDPYSDLRLAPGVYGQQAITASGGGATLPNTTGPGPSSLGIFQTENQIAISANGQRVSSNSYNIDGASVNSQTWGGAAVVTPNIDAVQEINVTTSSYSAVDSRNSGAIVKVVTKSGTNQFHGSGTFQYQDPNFNAYNKYGGPVQGEMPVRVDNNWKLFGGSVGGPIKKDKLFFFFSYSGLRSTATTFSTPTWVETPQYRASIHNLYPGSFADLVVNQPGIAPRVNTILTPSCAIFTNAGWPCQVVGNALDVGSPTGTQGSYVPVFSGDQAGGGLDGIPDLEYVQLKQPNSANPNQYTGRLDWTTGKQQFSLSGILSKGDQVNGDAFSRPADDLHYKPTNSSAMLAWISTISSSLLNELRFNFTRWNYNTITGSGNNWGLPGVDIESFPTNFRIQFGQSGNNVGTPAKFAENTYAVYENVTKTVGRHAFRFGGTYTWEQNNDTPAGQARPQYAFATEWNLVNSAPLFEGITANPVTGQPTTGTLVNFRTHYYGLYFQDDWKVTPTLTLNLGLRYEFYSPLKAAHGQTTNLFLGSTYQTALTGASVEQLGQYYQNDRDNFAPRIGFAWSPAKYDSNIVLRGGFGISYDRLPETLLLNSRANPPYEYNFGFCCGTAATEFGSPYDNGLIQLGTSSNSVYGYPISPLVAQQVMLGPNNLPIGSGNPVEIWGTPQNMPTPYTYVYSLEMETQLPKNFVFTYGYQGSRTVRETRILNYNNIYPVNQSISNAYTIQPDVWGNFNSLNLRLVRHFANNLELAANYRWSKSMDTLSYGGPGFVTNQTYPADQRYDYGPSDFDATNYATISAVYYLPGFKDKTVLNTLLGGFQISGIVTLSTGLPWTPVTYAYCIPQPGNCVSPTRPTEVLQAPVYSNSNSALTTANANFPGGGAAYFASPTGSILPAIGRNSFRGPDYRDIDLSLSKNFKLDVFHLGEGSNLQIRANLYNAFNILNLSNFNFGDSNTNINDPTFGRALTAYNGRIVELQARFTF
jgi:Carboxypeptidase regulatory-like domain/TonB dependent receptor